MLAGGCFEPLFCFSFFHLLGFGYAFLVVSLGFWNTALFSFTKFEFGRWFLFVWLDLASMASNSAICIGSVSIAFSYFSFWFFLKHILERDDDWEARQRCLVRVVLFHWDTNARIQSLAQPLVFRREKEESWEGKKKTFLIHRP